MSFLKLIAQSSYYGRSTNQVEDLTWKSFEDSSDIGNGTLSFSNGALPNGATATKLLGGVGSYVECVMPADIYDGYSVVLMLSALDDSNYNWASGPTFKLAVYNNGDKYYWSENNNSATPTNTLVPYGGGDVLRLERVAQDDVAIKLQTGGVGAFTTLTTRSGILTGIDYPFIKCVNAVRTSDRAQGTGAYLLNGRGYLLRSKILDLANNEVALFVMAGESNSGGIGENASASVGELAIRPELKILNNDTLLFESLDIGTNNLLDHAGLTATYGANSHSWELQLGNNAASKYLGPNTVYLCKVGQGGTTIGEYVQGSNFAGVDCWLKLTTRIDAAITQIQAAHPGKTIKIICLMSIGINDAIYATNTALFQSLLEGWISDFRGEYGSSIPIVFTKIMAGYNAYNVVLTSIATADSLIETVETSDAGLRDANHWNYAGQKLISERMQVAAAALV